MAPIATASFPLTSIFSGPVPLTLPPHTNRYIRTDLSAEGTTRACFILIPTDVKISLAIDFVSHSNQSFRTGDGTQPTSLASLSINLNLGHHELPTGIVEQWNVGMMGPKKSRSISLSSVTHYSITPIFHHSDDLIKLLSLS